MPLLLFPIGAQTTVTVTVTSGLTGAWGGGLNAKRRKHNPGQPRKLSDLDPKPLSTPEGVLDTIEAGEPQETNVDRAGLAAAAMAALDAQAKMRLAEQERARLARLADDDDNFIMVM